MTVNYRYDWMYISPNGKTIKRSQLNSAQEVKELLNKTGVFVLLYERNGRAMEITRIIKESERITVLFGDISFMFESVGNFMILFEAEAVVDNKCSSCHNGYVKGLSVLNNSSKIYIEVQNYSVILQYYRNNKLFMTLVRDLKELAA